MTTYVITIPGTFLRELTDDARSTLVRNLRPADPRHTSLGRVEELDVLTVNDNGTFSVRLEVEADDSRRAEEAARRTAAAALREAGYTEDEAPTGPAAVTGIDAQA
ncbi:hypothetical protein E2C00_01380 [Streptomyces sp. WAC05374]|uniref:hypothetical protein n=1 Tax=unclassified Streptomyces TaxID=2593676 RepID=UPI000F8981BA|nr:hypothetical protein [Streptomyces sp. WAC05374]RST17555.1 hypothetical protein EF905_09115 [Streptomyces sp. WAC05374]TDF50193.1 hypothetical protein E2B92_01355 [Streptomyces sp. WAC05374]TDF57918.1 hypothetical protein E2C02_09145 [Streptomyces sp. WAC05374]TDF60447.1 hypothetical protein E2C00_01380 [Streptomyces sp. WAC05374]